MEQNLELSKIKGIIKRRWLLLILPFMIVVAATAVVALILPSLYRSTATIMIKNQQIPQNLVQSTVTSYADQRIQAITQEVTSRTKILSLVDKFNLLTARRENLTMEDLVRKVRERISVEPIHADIQKDNLLKPLAITIAFTLSYEDSNPKVAQLVANEITSYFMEKNLEARAQHARSTTQFLDEQLKQTKEKLAGLEARLADYRGKHLEELPDFMSFNMQKVEKLSSEISNLNIQIRSAEEQTARMETQLALLDPYAGTNGRVLTIRERLQQAQLERSALAAKYSEKHPLVQAKDREVKLLEGRGAESTHTAKMHERLKELEQELSDLRSRYTEKHPAVRSKLQETVALKGELQAVASKTPSRGASEAHTVTNPAYVTLKADADKAAASIASMKAERARLEEQLNAVYEKLHSMPLISREYNEMMTDYEGVKTQLAELQKKHMAAQLAQGVEEENLAETFAVIEPAFLPEKPEKPNRLMIVVIGMFLGTSLSVGMTALKELTDTRVHDTQSMAQFSGVPILSVIPTMETLEDRMRTARNRVLLMIGAAGGLAVVVATIHFFVMDLYVFQAKLSRLVERIFII